MVAVVSPERMPRSAHGRMSESYDGRAEPVALVPQSGAVSALPRAVPIPACRSRRVPASTYRRRRAVAAGLVVLAVLALTAALGTLGGGPLPVPERPAPSGSMGGNSRVYIVEPGDTFWSIALRLDPTGDPRPLVDRLVAAHGSPTLHVGERLPLPQV